MWTFVSKAIPLLFNTPSLSQLFFRGASLNFMAVIPVPGNFGAQEECHCFPLCGEVMGQDVMTFLKTAFPLFPTEYPHPTQPGESTAGNGEGEEAATPGPTSRQWAAWG